MKHRRFVVASTIVMIAAAGLVAALGLYSNLNVNASIRDLPEAVSYLPSDSLAVFGMNVKRFVASPAYARFEEKHGSKIGADLADFIAKTGVDPRKDVSYLVAASRPIADKKPAGVMIAVGSFNTAGITAFIHTRHAPIEVKYKGATVLMIPERDGSGLEKGIAFLKESEIALGDLDSLKAVLDARETPALGIRNNETLAPLVDRLNSEEMFWFAGDGASILARAPVHTPLGGSMSAVRNVMGSLDLTDSVSGDITISALDVDAATQLAQVVQGFLALGQLSSAQNANLTELFKGVRIRQDNDQVHLVVNFPFELLERLEHSRPRALKQL